MNRLKPLAAIVGVAVVLGGLPVTTASAAPHPPTPGRLLGTFDDATLRHKAPTTIARDTVPGRTTCAATPLDSPERREGIVKACTETAPVISEAAVTKPFNGSAAAAADDTCSRTPPGGFWRHERFGSCLNGSVVNYTLFDDANRPVGTATLTLTTSMTLNSTSTTWNDTITVKVTNTTGRVTSMIVSMDVSCGTVCRMTVGKPWTVPKILAKNQSATGTVTYTDAPPAGVEHQFATKYRLFAVSSGAIPVQPTATWDDTYRIRCDRKVGASPGCVFSAILADLVLPLDQYGAAAATYAFAENSLIDHWGLLENPLRRQANEGIQTANRIKTCGTSIDPFVPLGDDVVLDDSCDEYPFAATLQGGTAGALCADIVPLLENGSWNYYEANPAKPITFNEPCVRGHVPETQNSAAGGKLGSFAQTDRVLDAERYTVTVP